jgi:hypothetical protein
MVSKTLLAKLLLIATCGGIFIGHYLIHQFSIPAETALRLSEASLMADGKVPYQDFLDNVTPFCLYLHLVPVIISRLTFFHPILITNLLTAVCFMLSAGAMALLSEVNRARRSAALDISTWPILITFVLAAFLQQVHFAQANQIFFLALCPYIVCRACTVRGLRVPPELATAIGAGLCLATMADCLYFLYLLVIEFCIVLGFFPFSNSKFVFRRYLGAEFKALVVLMTTILMAWLLMPSPSTDRYLDIITKLNEASYGVSLMAFNWVDTATDIRPQIFLSAFLLIVALPAARQSILVRLFAVASVLGFGLMVIQGATLSYQTYLFLSFAAMTFAAGLTLQPIVRQLFFSTPLFKTFAWPTFNLDKRWHLPVCGLVLLIFSLGSYCLDQSKLGPEDRFDLSALRYYGFADRRDLGILSDVVEKFSKVDQPVAILSLDVRPTYPLLTQLRRTPGLSLTWGFPMYILDVLEEPIHEGEMKSLKAFKAEMYNNLIKQLSAGSLAPVLVLIDEDEIRHTMEVQGAIKVLQDYYSLAGTASLIAPGAKDSHPPLEYVGYRAAFDIFRHK